MPQPLRQSKKGNNLPQTSPILRKQVHTLNLTHLRKTRIIPPLIVDESQLAGLLAVPGDCTDPVPSGGHLREGNLLRLRVPNQDLTLRGPSGQERPVRGPSGHAHKFFGAQVVAVELGLQVPRSSGEYFNPLCEKKLDDENYF